MQLGETRERDDDTLLIDNAGWLASVTGTAAESVRSEGLRVREDDERDRNDEENMMDWGEQRHDVDSSRGSRVP